MSKTQTNLESGGTAASLPKAPDWVLRLFRLSILKQQKWRALTSMLGPTDGLRCLDVGSDNGVISYLFRQRGGRWTSADLDAETVEAIRSLVGSDVVQLADGARAPFADGEFDRVVLVDCLEHLRDDRGFVREMARITKPEGEIIFNTPYRKNSVLRRARLAIGQTDEAHGHLRHGYTILELQTILPGSLSMLDARTYSKFFSEAVDTLMTWAIRKVKKQPRGGGAKGTVVTGGDVSGNAKLLKAYGAVYPFLWAVAQLDRLLWWRSGYMLLAKAKVERAAAK